MKLTEDFLVVLERTAVLACTHEVVVGHAAVVAAADGSTRLSTYVTALKHASQWAISLQFGLSVPHGSKWLCKGSQSQ